MIWTSQNDAGADHDIRSLTDNGGLLWIEVKSTTGTDGWFYWPKKEFEKALREREHYELWRVYESHTTHPIAKCFRDPISLLNRNALRLELGTLRAVICCDRATRGEELNGPAFRNWQIGSSQ